MFQVMLREKRFTLPTDDAGEGGNGAPGGLFALPFQPPPDARPRRVSPLGFPGPLLG